MSTSPWSSNAYAQGWCQQFTSYTEDDRLVVDIEYGLKKPEFLKKTCPQAKTYKETASETPQSRRLGRYMPGKPVATQDAVHSVSRVRFVVVRRRESGPE